MSLFQRKTPLTTAAKLAWLEALQASITIAPPYKIGAKTNADIKNLHFLTTREGQREQPIATNTAAPAALSPTQTKETALTP